MQEVENYIDQDTLILFDLEHAIWDKINIHPKKILFIDDGMRNLQSVMRAYTG